MKAAAVWLADLDRVRLDLPGPGFRMTLAITPDEALELAASIKRALGMRKHKTGDKA